MVRWEPGQGRGGSARSFGRRTQVTQVEGLELGSRAGSYRVGDAPQEHAHQRVGGPEHLHFLLHEMLLLGFGGKAESWAGASSSRGCGGGRDGGGRHSLPRTRASGSGSRPRLRSPTRKRCSPAIRHVTGGPPAGARTGRGQRLAPPLGRADVTWRECSQGCGGRPSPALCRPHFFPVLSTFY